MAVMLTNYMAHATGCTGKKIVYPPLLGAESETDTAAVDLQTDIQVVDDVRRKVHEEVKKQNDEYKRKYFSIPASPEVPAPGSTPEVPAKPVTPGTGDTVLTAALTDIDGLYDNFMNSLLHVNSTTGVTGSATVIQGKQLSRLISVVKGDGGNYTTEPAFVLLATIVAAGGTTQDHKTFWTELSTGDTFTYNGGAAVEVALWRVTESALVNWWSWYCRAAQPGARMEAITSRPLLLAAVGRAVRHGGQTTVYLTPMHAAKENLMKLISNVRQALNHVKAIAEQLPSADRWKTLLAYIVARIIPKRTPRLPTPGACLPA
jgi:hypothetical protein